MNFFIFTLRPTDLAYGAKINLLADKQIILIFQEDTLKTFN